MRMSPLGFPLWVSPAVFGYGLHHPYILFASLLCVEVLQGLSLCLQRHIAFMWLLGEEYLSHRTRLREDSALFLWLQAQNIWTLVIVSCCHLPLGLPWLDPRELILSSSDSSKGSSSWVLSVRCPAIPVHVTTELLIAAMRQLNRKPYHLKNHKTSFTHICWTLARDRHCGWWCKKGHKHKWRLVLSLVGVCSLAE